MSVVAIRGYSPVLVMAGIVAGGIVVQVYLAGLAVFGEPQGWAMHGMFGGVLAFPVIGLAIMSWIGPAGSRIRGPASLLMLLYLLQIVLVATGTKAGQSWLAALHPANALTMLLVALEVMRRTRQSRSKAGA